MARNKYPEETVNLILETAMRLFVQKGYEQTSIQDIVNNLGGLSKGAIYHHFKSKEEILIAVTNKMSEESDRLIFEIRNRTDMTGKEKLKMMLEESLNRSVNDKIFSAAPNIKSSPALVSSILMSSVEYVVPEYVLPIVKQGIADGSIQTEYPEELAELVMLVGNVWLDPMIFEDTPEKIYRKCVVYDKMLRGFGLDIIDDGILERLRSLTEIYCKNK